MSIVADNDTNGKHGRTMVAELSWDHVLGAAPLPPVDTPSRRIFREAVEAIAAQATAAYPDCAQRIADAVTLVRAGAVTHQPDGTALVQSQMDATKQYRVNGSCECADATYNAPKGRCKHRFARTIDRRATALAAERMAALDAPPTPKEVPVQSVGEMLKTAPWPDNEPPLNVPAQTPLHDPAPASTEAPYSVNVRVRRAGFEFQLTIRKNTGEEFYRLLETLPGWLGQHGYAPVTSGRSERSAAEAPTPTPATPPAPEAVPTCRYHGTQKMSPSKFQAGTFVCSVKLDDGSYCNQVWPRKSER